MNETEFRTDDFDASTLQYLGKYEMGVLLGLGAFSEVREVTDKASGTKYAMKIIDIEQSHAENVAVDNEIQILKNLRHPNIIRLFDVYWGNTKIFLVMELVTGGELFDRIVEKGHFTEQDAAYSVKKIVEAVHYLHENGIAHRDLKPENLLLSDKTERARVMIGDFGLSKMVSQEEMMRTACGTPGYVAPEVLNLVGYGKEVDLWSIGVISYVLLCGYAPFYGEKDADLFSAIMNGQYEFDSPYWDPISDMAKDFIRQLLTVDSAKRMTSKQALVHPWLRNIERQDSVRNLAGGLKAGLFRNPSTRRPDVKSVIDTAMDIRRTGTIRTPKPGDETGSAPPLTPLLGAPPQVPAAVAAAANAAIAAAKEAAAASSSSTSSSSSAAARAPSPVDDSPSPQLKSLDLNDAPKKRRDKGDKKKRASKVADSTGDESPEIAPLPTPVPVAAVSTPAAPSHETSTVSHGKNVRVLSYNFFLRPPLIKNNTSDYKDARLNLFLQEQLRNYDIIAFQEVFEYGSSRQDRLVEAAQRDGFAYSAKSPKKSILQGKIDGGLLILSRFPIVKTDFMKFERGLYADRLTAKGCLWAKVLVSPTRHLNVFVTHLQKTYRSEDGQPDMQCAFIRRSQLSFVKDFVVRKAETAMGPEDPILLLGDFEVDARSEVREGSVDSVDYLDMMDVLTGRDGNSERLTVEDPLRTLVGSHPVTFGEILREENGVPIPTDTTLTHKLDQCSQQRVDYLFWIDATSSSGIPTLERKSVRVEKFWVNNDKFSQLSDHYGIACSVFVPNIKRGVSMALDSGMVVSV